MNFKNILLPFCSHALYHQLTSQTIQLPYNVKYHTFFCLHLPTHPPTVGPALPFQLTGYCFFHIQCFYERVWCWGGGGGEIKKENNHFLLTQIIW